MSSAKRQTAAFPKSLWGDRFLNYNHHQQKMNRVHQLEEIEKLKEEVRKELLSLSDLSLLQQLELIDTIQSLGLEHHFESEIKHGLQHIYDTYYHDNKYQDHDEFDLHIVALSFRLLREYGYHISSGVFNKFKDNKGNFKEDLIENTTGMLSLYEAAFLRIHGEEILDEAIIFTTTHLQSMLSKLKDPIASQIKNALHNPQCRRAQRIECRRNILIYQNNCSHNPSMLKLSKLNFNYLQSLHRQELYEVSRMWKDLNFTTKLSFVRDRVVECYFWVLLISHEYEYSPARKLAANAMYFITIVDDFFDVYGTPEEHDLFAEAITRWNVNSMNTLPDYLKIIYKAMLDFFAEVEEQLKNKGLSYQAYYGPESVKKLVDNYIEESKWFRNNQTPTLEEYFQISTASLGFPLLLTSSLTGFSSNITDENLKWVLNRPKMVRAADFIGRVMNDIASHKFEQDRAHIASSVECYMKEYETLEQKACEELYKLVDSKWKEIYEECLNLNHLPQPILKNIVNLAKSAHVFYDGDDLFTSVGKAMEAHIEAMLVHPIPI